MVDIRTISIAIASAGVFAAAIYYIFQIRHQTKMRKTDLLMRLFSIGVSKDWLEAWEKVEEREVLGLDDYWRKYGTVEFNEVYVFLKVLGILLREGLIDIELVPLSYGQVNMVWEKIKPMLEDARKRHNTPNLGDEVEYLCNEMRKGEQRQA